jgi:hypothetical protein
MGVKVHGRIRRKLISAILSLVMLAALLPVTSLAVDDMANVETPVVVVTGSAVVGNDGVYSADNVGYEKAYTLEEIKEMGGETYQYSALNSYGTRKFYLATGTEITNLLEDTLFNAVSDKLTMYSADGFNSSFDPSLTKPNYTNTTGLENTRYYFPNFKEGSDAGKVAVPTILAWATANGGTMPTITNDLGGSLTAITGQLNVDDMNNPVFAQDIQYIIGGTELTETALTMTVKMNGKEVDTGEFTRADVLLKQRATCDYTYETSAGTRTDTVTGVPLRVLVEDFDSEAVVSFEAADGYDVSAFTMTVPELIAGNYMLAYEVNGESVYETAKSDSSVYGFFTLYGDGQKPVKMIDAINIKLPTAFTDLPMDKWYYDAVDYTVTNGIFKGMTDTTFEPESNIERGMFVTTLYRLENEPAVTAENKFPDVANGRYFTKPVIWATENNVVAGFDDGTFAPEAEMTREQMVTMLYRYAKYKGYDVSATVDLSAYTDADAIHDYAKNAFAWAVAEGIIEGMTKTTLEPAGNATRAQVATILMRFDQKW